MLQTLKTYKIQIIMALTVLVLYAAFAYDLERSDFVRLITLFAGSFYLSFKLIQRLRFNFKTLVILGVLARLIFIIALPNLSQDYYRFLWDGRLLAKGLSPYLLTPNQWVTSGEIPINQSQVLLDGMSGLSRQHFSNYPPVNQFFFWLSGILSSSSILGGVLVLRLCIIAADLGILWIGRKLLEKLKLPEHQIFWYFLNPFIIIELTGNLHFEGVMLFFLIASIYLLIRGNWLWSAVLMGCSISVKLLPLLLLPVLFQYLIKSSSSENQLSKICNPFLKKPLQSIWFLIRYYSVALLIFAVSFAPFLNAELLNHFTDTIALWFQKFEFNASIYYIVRWIGFQVKGYNIIGSAGKMLPVIVIAILLLFTFLRKNNSPNRLICVLLFSASIYFAFSTTVHPWYIATPLLLSVFTKYRYALIWSAAVILSYAAYQADNVHENLVLVALEYSAVASYLIWELINNKALKLFS
ncbi:mannosyltransferase [Leeuwenhoekiella marinoflava]|uniref:mannosyltransferase n=1 Tax=Leeuwenhoekiella marinoflava TaxID=988 RepID=UPI0030034D09